MDDKLIVNLVKNLKKLKEPRLNLELGQIISKITSNIIDNKHYLELEFTLPITLIEHEIRQLIMANIDIFPIESDSLRFVNKIPAHQVSHGAKKRLGNIKNIIAVGSGKGGVGKSTVALNLAVAIAQCGAKVGLLDADFYGPSQPSMLGVDERALVQDNKILPFINYGIEVMSMGFLVDKNTPIAWRGPMLAKALQQTLYDTAWSNLDYLVVDLPPGTGDVQITLAQQLPVTSAVIVTTPQEVAVVDARRAAIMFQKLKVNLAGVIENMSTYTCINCSHTVELFAAGGGNKLASELSVPLLGKLPFELTVRECSDNGRPIVDLFDHPIAKLYRELAIRILLLISQQAKEQRVLATTLVN